MIGRPYLVGLPAIPVLQEAPMQTRLDPVAVPPAKIIAVGELSSASR